MTKNVSLDSVDQNLALVRRCAHERVVAGAKAAVIASVATAITTICLEDVTMGKNLSESNCKALIVSTAAEMAYFVIADKTLHKIASQNSFK
ncbi:hypothetical protein P3S68_008556 [Capsicum galapagoense]